MLVGVRVTVKVRVGVMVGVGFGVRELVAVRVGVTVRVLVGMRVAVGGRVLVGVAVGGTVASSLVAVGVGLGVGVSVSPKPLRATVCAAPRLPESSAIVSSPLTGPGTDGAKLTETVQLDPALRTFGQSLVSVKPLSADMVARSSGLPPKLEIVTGCAPLVVPTSCSKVKLLEEKPIAEGRGFGREIGVMPKT